MVIYEESFSSPKKKESPRWDGVAQGWEYIAGAHYLRANPSILTKNKLKSGNLEKVTTLKPGTYSGVIESTNRNGKFDVSVSTKVGKEQRIDTKIGRATLVVELESVMGNADGNGAVVRRSAFYSKSFRLIINEKVEVSKPSAWIFPYDCEVQGVKRRSRVPKSKLAEFSWPKAGTELSYKCEGSIKSLKMNVIKNQKDNVIVEIIRDSQKPFRAAGPGGNCILDWPTIWWMLRGSQ